MNPPHGNNSLAKDAIAVLGQMAQSVAHIAPAVAVIFTAAIILNGANTAACLAIVMSCLGVFPSVYLHSKLQARWSGAGGYFSILPPAFGPCAGTAAGLLDFFYEPLITSITIFGFIGFGFQAWLGRTLSFWEVVALSQLLSLIVFLLSGRKVHIISKVLFTFGIGEVLLFVAMGIALLSKSTLSVEMLDSMIHPANFSFSAFGTAALFGVLMFVGFESGIPFSEETKNAASSYVKAVWLSTVLTGGMFLLSYFALVAACYKGGPLSDISLSDLAALPSPFFDKVAPSVFGDFGRLFLFLVLLISTISSGLASFGAGSRNLFAFARFGVLPQSIARTCSTTGVPRGGNSACYLLTVVMGLALACINDPKLAFEYSATTFGTIAVFLYLLVALAGLTNYRVLGASSKERFFILVLSLIDAIIFGYIIFFTIRDCSSKEGLVSTAPALIGCCLGISILWSLLLNKYRPEVVQKMLTRSKP